MEVNGITDNKDFMDALQKEVGVLYTSNIFLASELKKANDLNIRMMAQAETDKENYNALVDRLQKAETGLRELQETSTDPTINRALNRTSRKVKGNVYNEC